LAFHSGYGKKLNIDNQWLINDVIKAEVKNKIINFSYFHYKLSQSVDI